LGRAAHPYVHTIVALQSIFVALDTRNFIRLMIETQHPHPLSKWLPMRLKMIILVAAATLPANKSA